MLPLGTFNHFARGLGIPTGIDAAIRTIAQGTPQLISAGRVNGRLFLNNAALGLAPQVVVQRRESHGSRVTRALATAPVALGALRHPDQLHLDIEADGRSVSFVTPFVFLTPNDYAPHLFRFAVRERRSDGRLNAFLATSNGLGDAVRIAFHVLRGHLDRHLHAAAVARAEITARRNQVSVLMDGDVMRLPSPLVIEGVRDAVRVIIPPAPPESPAR